MNLRKVERERERERESECVSERVLLAGSVGLGGNGGRVGGGFFRSWGEP